MHESRAAALDYLVAAVALDVGDRRAGEELPVLDLAREGGKSGARSRIESANGMLESRFLARRAGSVRGELGAEAARHDRFVRRAELPDRRLRHGPEEGRVREVRPGSWRVGLESLGPTAVGVDREGRMGGIAAGQEHPGGGLQRSVAGRRR